MNVARYDFHGVLVEVASELEEIANAIGARLRDFETARGGEPAIVYCLRVAPDGAPHAVCRPGGKGRPVYAAPAGEVLYFDDQDALWVDYEDRVRVRATRRRVDVSVRPAAAADVWLLSRPLFTIPLVELLKRHGLYSVHAAGVASDAGRAVLLPGGSGSGKSTLTVGLALHGWRFMADDMVFLARRDQRVTVLGFPDEVDVTPQTAALFPQLSALTGAPPDGWPKHRLRAGEALAASVLLTAAPAALVFPEIGPADASSLDALPAGDAMLELAPNVLLTDAASSQAHLDALAELARATPAHRLATGRDFARVSRMLAHATGG